MLHEHQAELGIIAWPNLDPLLPGLTPLLVMREAVPLVVAPDIAAKLPPRYTVADVLQLVPRVIMLRWWQADPDGAVALSQRSQTCVELPTGPARRLAIKGAGFGAFVRSAIIDDLDAGRLVIIEPIDFEPLHRDTALVTLSPDVARPPSDARLCAWRSRPSARASGRSSRTGWRRRLRTRPNSASSSTM